MIGCCGGALARPGFVPGLPVLPLDAIAALKAVREASLGASESAIFWASGVLPTGGAGLSSAIAPESAIAPGGSVADGPAS